MWLVSDDMNCLLCDMNNNVFLYVLSVKLSVLIDFIFMWLVGLFINKMFGLCIIILLNNIWFCLLFEIIFIDFLMLFCENSI